VQWEQLMRGFFREAVSQPVPGQSRPGQATSFAG
jgi:hypothetical protein